MIPCAGVYNLVPNHKFVKATFLLKTSQENSKVTDSLLILFLHFVKLEVDLLNMHIVQYLYTVIYLKSCTSMN